MPIGDGRVHRRRKGDLLHPEREPQSVLDEMLASMGTAIFSAQYLQKPVPTSGNLVKWEWFRRWTKLPEKEKHKTQIVQSWDTASKGGELNDYSVGITAMVRKDEIHILDVVRARLEYPALKKRIIAEKRRYQADKLLIEDKGSGMSLIQDLRKDGVFSVAITPESDKVVRMATCSARIEDGCVLLPATTDWLDEFRSEILAFPNGTHDDQVDALSQLINWTRTKSNYTLDNL